LFNKWNSDLRKTNILRGPDDDPMNIPSKFGFNLPCVFREDKNVKVYM